MMTLVIDGSDVPMKQVDKPAAPATAAPAPASPAPAPAAPAASEPRRQPPAPASSRAKNSGATLATITVQDKALNINPAGGSNTNSPSTANGAPKIARAAWNAVPVTVTLDAASTGADVTYFVDKDSNWDRSPDYKPLPAGRAATINLGDAAAFPNSVRVCVRVVSEDGATTKYYRFEVGP
jgi:hypothetical protein